jgi:hypothetical protein
MEKHLVLKKKAALEKAPKTTATVGGTPEDIYKDVMESKFRNLFQAMFKSLITHDSVCEDCGCNKCLQRCHAGRTRPQIGLQAIRDAPVKRGMRSVHDILINFVSLHMDEPVRILCQTCHRKFDAKPKPKEEPKPGALPKGWKIETRVRKTGNSAGRIDKYYRSPNGKVFRSYVTAYNYWNAPTGCRPRVSGS